MRKFTFLIALMFTIGFSMAQTIENFESLKMNIMLGGAEDLSSFTIIPNPDPTGINTSTNVVKYLRDKDGVPWGGFYATLDTPIDLDANKYIHVWVWKPRISPIKFKLERADGNIELESINPQTVVNGWEEIVFSFADTATGLYTKIVFFPDFEDPLTLTEDIIIYFDHFFANNDPTPGSAPVQVMETYEHIPLNYMGESNPLDESSMEIFPNPDISGLNPSDYVIKFERDKDGVPWGGFWSELPVPVDVTTNKYMHVKVWKSRISPLKFKLEGGAAGPLEIESMEPQQSVNAWEDIVFDFSDKTGTYPKIAFMPDFEDPLALEEDITIYFDDIILSNDPNPFQIPNQVFHVDMSEAGNMTGVPVYISGAFGGVNGTWAEPGTIPENEMFDTNGDLIYTIVLHLPPGTYPFKFFKGTGWDGGDPVASGDRVLDIDGDADATYKWNVSGILTLPQNPLVGHIEMYPNPVSSELIINNSKSIQEVTITSMLGQKVATYQLNNDGRTTINTNDLSNGLYFVTFYGKDGSRLVQKLIKN